MRHIRRWLAPVVVIVVIASVVMGVVARRPQNARAATASVPSGCGQWRTMPSANPGTFNDQLFGIAAVSASDIWAVGDEGDQAGGPNFTLTEHWNGSVWTIVPGYADQPNSLWPQAATAVSGTQQVLSVGYETIPNTNITLATRWNGTTWTRIQTDSPSSTISRLFGVTALSSSNAWAVGSYIPPATSAPTLMRLHRRGIKAGIPQEWTLILHYVQPQLGIACSL